jgi:phosphoribosylformylglycinamidine (FGAM) synthase-like enzyme|uniref:PurM-like C-terminal domain-containing protein n=1 Tax=Populus trichocarpa TaxID=3694 RepID=B9IB96_POPTR
MIILLRCGGHDISYGGLFVCTMEMTFAGNCGILLDLTLKGESHFETLFAKDLIELKVDGGYLLKEEASFLRDI